MQQLAKIYKCQKIVRHLGLNLKKPPVCLRAQTNPLSPLRALLGPFWDIVICLSVLKMGLSIEGNPFLKSFKQDKSSYRLWPDIITKLF